MLSRKPTLSKPSLWLLWFERLMGLVALGNLLLVGFNLTYIKIRDFYLAGDLYVRQFPDTQQKKYIQKVDELKQILAKNGLDSPQVEPFLQDLRQMNLQLVEANQFRVLDQYGSLEEIKSKFNQHLNTENFQNAVEIFWSKDYLAKKGWRQELEFFDTEIRYLVLFYEPKLFYDPIKGIEPYRDTQDYLKKVDQLKYKIPIYGLEDARINAELKELQKLSSEMIEKNPFEGVNKSGKLEEIKARIRRHIYSRSATNYPQFSSIPELQAILLWLLDNLAPEVLWAKTSAKQAFNTFWSPENLAAQGWEKELNFFDQEIRLLMQSNYFRHLGQDSEFIDRFWLIDLPFIGLFLLEFLGRTALISRRQPNTTWIAAMGERWYDIFLLLPFSQLLRVIPVIIRLDQTKFPDLEPIRSKMRLGFVASFAEEMTQAVVIRVIDQVKEAVERGDMTRSLLEPKQNSKKQYIDINNTNEIQEIANRLLQITICHGLPAIGPELEEFLRYQIEKAMKKSSFYQRIERIPGLKRFPHQVAEGLVTQVTKMVTQSPQNAYNASQNSEPDPIATELSERLVKKFSSTMREQLQNQHTLEEIESLLCDFLEEIKLNYVKRLPEEEIQQILPRSKVPPQLTGS